MATPRKPTDRLSKAVKPAPIPVMELSTDAPELELERIPFVKIDGVMYTIPAEVEVSFSLRALDVVRKQGQEAALSWILEEMLGRKGYQALLNCKSITKEQFETLMETTRKHAMGDLEDELGK